MAKLSKLATALIPLCVPSAFAANSILTQDTLSGDWGGSRTYLDQQGLDLQAEYTNVYQANVKAPSGTQDNLSHRVDLFANLDFEKLGLWNGGKLHSQMVYRDGEANDLGFTSLSVPNAGHYGHGKTAFVSALYYSHSFSTDTKLMIGKIDAFELLKNASFYGGATRYGFMNIAFAAPPSGLVPPAFLGAMASHKMGSVQWTAMIFDPRDRYTDSLSFNEAFKDGVNLSLGATHSTQWFGRDTSLGLSFAYSTEEGTDFSTLEPDMAFSGKVRYKHNLRAEFSHNLIDEPDNTLGIYLRGAIADGNPNIINRTFAGGFGGNAGLLNRSQDSWGLGYYYYDLSDDLQNSIDNLPLPARIDNEQGIEAYYAYQAVPWLTFTLDAQYVTPAISTQDNAFILGLRTNIKF